VGKKGKKSPQRHSDKITLSALQKHLAFSEDTVGGAVTADEISGANNLNTGYMNIGHQENNTFVINDHPKVSRPLRAHLTGEKSESIPFHLPQHDFHAFTGRQAELKRLETLLLTADGSRPGSIVGICGTGGMGKSTLVSHFATLYRERFPDGVIGLQVDDKQVDSLAEDFASLAGLEISTKQKPIASQVMQSAFQDKRLLLILDNVQSATMKALRPFNSQCAMIITSRDRGLLRNFGIPDEAHIELQGFPLKDSFDLLRQLLGESKVADEVEGIEEIHELVGGLPLALRIVGGILQEQSFRKLTEYALLLRKEKDKLLSRLHDPVDPDVNVRATFRLSLIFLKKQPQIITLFASLGACAPEGFSLQTAQIVSGQDDVGYGMGRLLSLALVNPGAKNDWFVLHPLLFLFSRELTQDENVLKENILEEAIYRHTKHFSQYAKDHKNVTRPGNKEALEMELDALLLTAERISNNIKESNEFFRCLARFLEESGYWMLALDLIKLFIPAARVQKDNYRLAQFLLQKGKFSQLLSQFAEAEQALQESRSFALQIENDQQRNSLLTRILNSLGGVYVQQNQLNLASEVLKQSYKLSADDKENQAVALNLLGKVNQRLGKFEDANKAFEQSFAFGQGNERHMGMALNSRGSNYLRQGNFDEAINSFQESYELRVRLGDERGQSESLHSLGGAYLRKGKIGEAIKTFQQSYDLRVRLKDEPGQAMVLNSLGKAYVRQHRLDEAVKAFQESLAIDKAIDNPPGQAKVLNSLGGAYQRQHKLNAAIEAFQESLAIEIEIKNERGQAMVLNSLGKAYLQQGRRSEGIKLLQQSYDLLINSDDELGQAMVSSTLGEALFDQKEYKLAAEKLKHCLEIYKKHKKISDLCRTTSIFVEVCIALDQIEDAKIYYQDALTLAPDNKLLLSLQPRFSTNPVHKVGHIKRILHNPSGGIYGYIHLDEGKDIYFNQGHIDTALISHLTEGQQVKVEIDQEASRPRARYVWLQ
jgi:tetratricopeptide (TPR) repeat protein